MKAIILAAGRGSRLGSFTEDIPKGCVSLAGVPLIQRQINTLRNAGISDIAIVTGYRSEAFAYLGLTEFHNPLWSETNMVYSLVQANKWLDRDHCLVTYADILYEGSLVHELNQIQEPLVLPVNMNWRKLWEARFENPLEDLESLSISPSGHLIDIGKRVDDLHAIEGQFMGVLAIQPAAWQKIKSFLESVPHLIKTLDMTMLLNHLVEKNILIYTLKTDSAWIEIDDGEDLELYNNWIKSGFLTF